MKSEYIYNGINGISDDIIVEAANYEFQKSKKKPSLKWIKYASVAACFCLVAGLAYNTVLHILNGSTTQEPSTTIAPTTLGSLLVPEKILVGFEDVNSKETTGEEIAYICDSFVKKGENLNVTVYVGDRNYDTYQSISSPYRPTYDLYGVNGYPFLKVYLTGLDNSVPNYNNYTHEYTIIEGELKINDFLGKYEKKFAKTEMKQISIDPNYGDVSKGKQESVKIDFSNCKVGSCGEVIFSFSWELEKWPEDNKSWYIRYQRLYYYVGEEGVSISDTNNAKEKYETHYKSSPNISLPGKFSEDAKCTSKEYYLLCKSEFEREYKHGDIIEKIYELVSVYDVEEICIEAKECSGIEFLTSIVKNDNNGHNFIILQFRVKDDTTFDCFDFSIEPVFKESSLKDVIIKQSLYILHDGEKDYISLNTVEGLANYSNAIRNQLHEIDAQGEYIELGTNTSSTYQLSESTTRTVSGYIKWTDSAGNPHPAEGVTVQIYKGTGSISSLSLYETVTTSTSGYYSSTFSYDGSVPILRIRVLSSGTNINVVGPANSTYSYDSNIIGGSSNITINYTANNTTTTGKSLSVHQGLVLANKYIYTLESHFLNPINVHFGATTGTSYFSPSTESITILEADAFDWDVTEHEFGHYVQNTYAISDSPGGSHNSNTNLAEYNDNKSTGIHLAWGEGWATYFAINLQNKMNAATLNIPCVGDTYYQDTQDSNISYDIEDLPAEKRLGEANEATVAAVLYDITDPINTAEGDYVFVQPSVIWSLTKNSNCTTLSDFINAYNSSASISKQNKVKLGSTLSRYAVAAQQNFQSISNNTVIFTWQKQGGSPTYGNNRFRLLFFDASYNIIYSTGYTTSTSQSISLSLWNSMLSNHSTVHCCVESSSTTTPVTGPYYSNLISTSLAK